LCYRPRAAVIEHDALRAVIETEELGLLAGTRRLLAEHEMVLEADHASTIADGRRKTSLVRDGHGTPDDAVCARLPCRSVR